MKTPRGSAHRADAVDFLNGTLRHELPQPGYMDNDSDGSSTSDSEVAMAGFANLIQSLRDKGLLFSQELIANYILALQTKRFAILTGISGTGKTTDRQGGGAAFRTRAEEERTSAPG